MTELAEIFAELGISHYLHDFVEQGFDTWDTILDITESDFDALNVKLGHRRKIQRKIALSRGLSSDRALASPGRHTPNDERGPDEQKSAGTKAEVKEGAPATQGAKRKYRRHPKADDNAPERPPSAYVIFSNKMREDLKGRNLSFTEIAKLVGENWQNLSSQEREPYEQQAFSAKEKYNAELAEYKKTEQYKEYSQYLVEFKARHAQQQQTEADPAKRPKLEAHVSGTSTTTNSSSTNSITTSQPSSESLNTRAHVDSSTTPNSWPPPTRQCSPPTQSPGLSQLAAGVHAQVKNSPSSMSPSVLPGYRDAIYGGSLPAPSWREQRDDAPAANLPPVSRMSEHADMRTSYAGPPAPDSLNLTGSLQHAHRTGHSQRPPLLSSESTSGTTSSSVSTNSSFFTPRTPLEPSIDRSLPMPQPYQQKPYENHLPPLRPPSLSPQTSMLTSQHSPHGIPAILDFPTTMAPMRGQMTAIPRQRPLMSGSPRDEGDLDPVSALLKAGEIVDRNSRSWSTTQ
ncbi:HMG box protein [Phlyctema vagabunda]|uniref:HMG box protein n=1 Tax=Phlyctema vagabunda TaxID=108571 RepID=A0ABR4PKJ3_9HELO